MNEEGDTPTVPEAVQSTPKVSLNNEIAPKTDNKKIVFQRIGSLIGRKKSKDKTVVESEETVVAQLKKELDECRVERDRFKTAHLTSEAEKKELMTKMDEEAKLGATEMEILKRESDILSEKLQARRDEIDRYKNELDTNASRMTEMEDEIKSKSAEIDNLKKSGDESRDISSSSSVAAEVAGRWALKAFNNMYIGSNQWYVYLDLLSPSRWTIIEQNGKIAILTDRYEYMRAHPNGRVDLADSLAWGIWTPVKNDDGTWSFRSQHGTWLSASRKDVILCTKPHNERCERFKIESCKY